MIPIDKSINLKDIIAPVFYEVHKDIKNDLHTHYFLKGGRGSTKSSFISIELILTIIRDDKANAIVFRKYGTDLKDTVFNQVLWAIDMLQANQMFKINLSPLKITYISTGQEILFRGLDDANKSKSIKPKHGYFKFIWFEEADQFSGMEEIRKVIQSLMRGGNRQKVFYTYNPPKSIQNWINSEVLIQRKDRLIHHSTYLDVPNNWLGEQFYIEAEHLKRTNENSYNHEYMGEVTGTGGEVFSNVTLRPITDEEIETFDKIYRGLDFGFSVDPCAYVSCHLHNNKLYIFYEYYKVNASYSDIVENIKKENTYNDLIYCDSAEPRSISELLKRGIRCTGAIKGKGSVNYGIGKLQDLTEIIIDNERCPNVAREFTTYEIEKDRNGNFKAEYPDKNNHSIDAVRYALSIITSIKKKEPEIPSIYDSFGFSKPKTHNRVVGADYNSILRR